MSHFLNDNGYARGMREKDVGLCWKIYTGPLGDEVACIRDRGHDDGQHEPGVPQPQPADVAAAREDGLLPVPGARLDMVEAVSEYGQAREQRATQGQRDKLWGKWLTAADAYADANAAAARAEAERRAEGAEREIRAAWEVPCRCKSRNPADDSPRASYKVCGACEVRHAMATARYAAQALAEAPAEEEAE